MLRLSLPRGRRFPPPPAHPSARGHLGPSAPTSTTGATTSSPTATSPLQRVLRDTCSRARLAPPAPTPTPGATSSSPIPTSPLELHRDACSRGRLASPAPTPTSGATSSATSSLAPPAPAPTSGASLFSTPTSRLQTWVHRSFCTIGSQLEDELALHPPPNDLLSVSKRYASTDPFNIGVGKGQNLQDEIDRDTVMLKKHRQIPILKEMFDSSVRAALMRRGLLWDYPIIAEETRVLHIEYGTILGKPPTYLTAYRCMVHLVDMPRPYWKHFLDYLSYTKTIVINDWSETFHSNLGITMYDHGVRYPRDDILYCKGESDGSYTPGEDKGTTGVIIWRGNQVGLCEIYTEVPCDSSMEAEIKAMFLQLKRGTPFEYLQPCTDNYAVYRVVKGELDSIDGVADDLCELLRGMRGQYKGLIVRLVPREEISFVDGLVKDPQLREAPVHVHDGSYRFIARGLIRSWSSQLSGVPIFKLQGQQPSVRIPTRRIPQFPNNCYLVAEEEGKVDALFHVCYALRPTTVHVVTRSLKPELQSMIIEQFADCEYTTQIRSHDCHILSVVPQLESHKNSHELTVVLDLSTPTESYSTEDDFTVYLVTTEEKKEIENSGIKEFGPLSFAAFHQMI